MKNVVLALLMGLIITACSAQHTKVTHGVPNLHQVGPSVWRGGQPTDEGWAYLKSLGLTNVVKLNEQTEGRDDPAFSGYYDPISIEEQILGVPPYKIDSAVSHIGDCFYVHCSHGQDRTGLICAVYRVKHDGWTKAKAEKEMLANGFHKELHGLWDWWEDWKP